MAQGKFVVGKGQMWRQEVRNNRAEMLCKQFSMISRRQVGAGAGLGGGDGAREQAGASWREQEPPWKLRRASNGPRWE